MLKIIFFSMAIVALSLAAMPVMNIIEGVSAERDLMNAQMAALEMQQNNPEAGPSAEDLNAIEAAAGGFEDTIEDGTGELSSGFSGQAPDAL